MQGGRSGVVVDPYHRLGLLVSGVCVVIESGQLDPFLDADWRVGRSQLVGFIDGWNFRWDEITSSKFSVPTSTSRVPRTVRAPLNRFFGWLMSARRLLTLVALGDR